MDLVLERQAQPDRIVDFGPILLTPSIAEDYWLYRVRLSDTQAIVAFPKFLTIGIGFAVEASSWNTNFPFRVDAEAIYEHIADNKGDDSISREDCLAAIRMIQAAITSDLEAAE